MVGEVWGFVFLFKRSKLLFLLLIIVPPVGWLLFLVTHFYRAAWKPVTLVVAGIALACYGLSLMSDGTRLEIGL